MTTIVTNAISIASGKFGQTTDGVISKLDLSSTEGMLQYITQHREDEIRKKIGRFFHHDESMMSSSSELKVGKFQFGDDIHRIQPFVFVPVDYEFKDFDQLKAIFDALGISPMPDLVFSFDKNNGIVPSENKKNLEGWKAFWKDEGGERPEAFTLFSDQLLLQDKPSSPGIAKEDINAFAKNDSEEIIKVESHVENILKAIADDFKKTLFLITEPFRGNALSEFACKAANGSRNNTPALGLFDVGSNKAISGGDFTVLMDTTGRDKEYEGLYQAMKEKIEASKNQSTLAWDSRMSEKENEFRLPVPRSIFELCTVPLGDTPRSVIKIDCDFTEYEKKLYDKNNRVQHIPGGLANECSHLLVFATRDQKLEFIKHFSDASAMGHFASGSTECEMKLAVKALNQGKPLFVLAGTGPVATITQTFIERDNILKNLYSKHEVMANTKTPPFMNEGAVDVALLLSNTQNGMINHFNPDAYYVIDFETSCKHNDYSKHDNSRIQEIKDRITEVMATAFDFNNEIGGEEEDMRAIDLCQNLVDKIEMAEARYKCFGTIIQISIQSIVLSVIITTVWAVRCKNKECDEALLRFLRTTGLALPIIAAALQAIDKAFRFETKYANLLITKNSLESEKFYFRARIGIYSSFDKSQGRKYDNARKIFMERCNNLYAGCMQTEVRDGALYTHIDRFRGKSRKNPKEQDFMPSSWFRKLFWTARKYEKWQGKQMKKTIQAFDGWQRRNIDDKGEKASESQDEEAQQENEAEADENEVDETEADETAAATNAMNQAKVKENEKKRKAIRNLKLLEPLQEILENKKNKTRKDYDGEEIKRLEEHQLHFYGLEEDEINRMKKVYKKLRKVKEAKFYKEHYSIISVDDYVRFRLLPKQKEFQKFLPTCTLARNCLQILVIFLTASSTYLVAVKREDSVPIVLGIAAACEAIRNYFYLDTRSPVLHLVDSRLEQIKFDVGGLGVLDKRLPSNKKDIIDRAEQAILSNYIFLAESTLKSQQEKEDKYKEEMEDAETRGRLPSS